jgi:hypothetical protein
MNRFASLSSIAVSAVALLAVGCANSSATPAATARAPLAQPARATPRASQGVELRHLLSPGPSATLVVTRSDVATGDR